MSDKFCLLVIFLFLFERGHFYHRLFVNFSLLSPLRANEGRNSLAVDVYG